MRNSLVVLILSISAWNVSSADTETQYISRVGYSSSFCSGVDSYFCIDRIKQAAQRDAQQSADLDCRIRRGNLDSWSRSCLDSCFPSFIPTNGPSQNVNCSSNCNFTCKITK